MLNRVLTFVFVLITVSAAGQSFEGKILYRNTYKSKIPSISSTQFTQMMGTNQEYYIKGANYKSVNDGTYLQWQLYLGKTNALYNKTVASPKPSTVDASVNTNEVLKAEINKGVETIAGYLCDELILTCKNGIEKYYFNRELAVNAELFVNHKYGNWYEFLSRSGAVPLKMIVIGKEFELESVAVEVSRQKLDEALFQLPQ